ncbi:hypothetical protein LPBF_07510 [Flavobacterium crassostreae]|uniref:Uncharacterized protein n=1 Tax=Flavobacterium crassostreae TaxID=1763534 RepID=A0A1B9E2I8_9FLAO|nr:hypothetical protein LPBF_07510 [Flavobacterium crassostreae]
MKKNFKFNYIGFVAIVLLAVSCTKEPFLEDQLVLKTAAAKGSIVRATTATQKLLIIGIDGCKPDALLAANTPNVQGLLSNNSLGSISKAFAIFIKVRTVVFTFAFSILAT